MPLPSPNSGESKSDFLDRCMANGTMNSEYPDSDQRYAVCNSLWDDSRGDVMGDKMNYRAASVKSNGSGPSSIDEEARTVDAVGATESPVEVFDWERWDVISEVLLMDGIEMPKNRQIPLLDSHSRFNTASVLGSYRDMYIEDGQLMGRVHFSSVPEADGPWTKVREGHLTDFSIGYRPVKRQWVPEDEKAEINGRSFDGPVMVVTRWRAKELSAVPIGADELAKARGDKKPETENTDRGVKKMKLSEELRAYLESKGLKKDATDEEAFEFMNTLRFDQPEVKPAEGKGGGDGERTEIDPEKARDEIRAELKKRDTEIRAMCRDLDISDADAAAYLDSDKTVDQVREAIMKKMIEDAKGGVGHRKPAEVVRDERDKFKAAAVDALLIRSGRFVPEKPVEGARDLSGWTIREMARHCLSLVNDRGHGTLMEMMGRALVTGDLPYIMANVANKALFAGWDTAPQTWMAWCATDSVNDFKTHYSPRASETDDLEEVPEHGEYQYGTMAEAQETYSIATYGKIFAVTRQALINDDLSALTRIPAMHGEAASRKVGDVAYAVLTANAAMGDGTNLFDAGHSNVGTGGVPNVTTIGEAIKLMKLQKDIKGLRRLNIRPEYFLAPVELEASAEVFFNSFQFADEASAGTPDEAYATTRRNPYAGTYFNRIYEPRLDDNSTTAWYLAGPKGKTVVLFFLNGIQTPYMETKDGWTVDGVEYKVRIDVGAKAMDWKGLVYNAGT